MTTMAKYEIPNKAKTKILNIYELYSSCSDHNHAALNAPTKSCSVKLSDRYLRSCCDYATASVPFHQDFGA